MENKFIEELKKEYSSQDNRCTAYPIYVTVQEKHCVGVLKDGYSANCPYGDDEIKMKYTYDGYEGTFDSIEDVKGAVEENDEEFDESYLEEYTVGYIWVPVEFFLTIKGAEEYIKANQHNHNELRTYVHHFERRNFEMNNLLNELGFKVK